MILIKQIKASASSKNMNTRSSVRISVLLVRIMLSAKVVVVICNFLEKPRKKFTACVCSGTYDGVAVSVRKGLLRFLWLSKQ